MSENWKPQDDPSAGVELQRGLPSSVDSERFILGSILLDDARFVDVAGLLDNSCFTTEAHRRIFTRMTVIHARGEKIDRVTVAEELQRFGELESVGGFSYIISLDDGLPHIANIDSYIRIVRDKAMLRRIAVASQQLMNRALLAEEDPQQILAGAEETLMNLAGSGQSEGDGLMSAGDFLRGFPGGFNAFASPSTRVTGLQTGFTRYDELTGGLRAGEMTILAARPSMGKSALAMNIAWNIAIHHQVPVAVFSLEMSQESLLLRILCGAARIDNHRLRLGYLNELERQKIRQAAGLMLDAPLYIDDSSNIGLMEMHAKLRRFRQTVKQKPGLVIVDYLQLMSRPGKGDNENSDLTKLSRGLKLMSKDLDCPFLVLSQLSRASEMRAGDKKPQLSDLRGSGALEQDADVVAFVHRSEVYHPDREDLRGQADLILGKQRNGATGSVPLVFLHQMVRFENRAEDIPDGTDGGRLPYADQ